MCKASIEAANKVDAQEGQTLLIGYTNRHGFPAFHAPGVTADDCVVCVKNGTILKLDKIPKDLQDEFGIKASDHAIFVDKGDNREDYLEFSNDDRTREIELRRFAGQSIEATVMPSVDLTNTSTAVTHDLVTA